MTLWTLGPTKSRGWSPPKAHLASGNLKPPVQSQGQWIHTDLMVQPCEHPALMASSGVLEGIKGALAGWSWGFISSTPMGTNFTP